MTNTKLFFDTLDRDFSKHSDWPGDSENVSNIPAQTLIDCDIPTLDGAIEYFTAYGDLCAHVHRGEKLDVFWFDFDASVWFSL